jgi:hypothetical protein
MGWGSEQANAISRAEEKVQKDREWQLYASSRIKAECSSLFRVLSDQISAYVKEFNAARGEASVDCKHAGDTLEVTKASGPTKYLRLSLDSERGSVTVYKRTTDWHSVISDEYDQLRFSVDNSGAVRFCSYVDCQSLAQSLLSDVFGSFLRL